MAEGLPDFRNRRGFEAWLRSKPREWCIVLAARGALRVLPAVEGLLGQAERDHRRTALVLPIFRVAAAPWLVSSALSHRGAGERGLARAIATAAADADAAVASAGDYSRAGIAALAAIAAASAASGSAADAIDARAVSVASGTAPFIDSAAAEYDAAALSLGTTPETLAQAPLWPDELPAWASSSWKLFKEALEAADEGWAVWIGWYEARLRGEPADLALWEKVVLIPDADWEQGPAHVNALIARIIAEHEAGKGTAGTAVADTGEPPALPIELPSPTHFEFRDGAVRPSPRPPTSPPNVATESAWRGVKESLDDFADRGGGGEVGVRQVVARCRAAMGERFADLDVTLLGVHAGRLAEFARRADEVLLAEDAADLIALDHALSTFVAQFEAWRSYVAAIAAPFAEPRVEQKAVDDAAAAVDAIQRAAPEIIAPETMEILDPLREAAQRYPSAKEPAPVAPAAQRRSYLRAVGSLFVSIGQQLVADARAGTSKGVQKIVEGATVAAIAGGAGYLVALATGLPSEFAWLGALVSYALRLLGKSP